jgi:hypothetical protein
VIVLTSSSYTGNNKIVLSVSPSLLDISEIRLTLTRTKLNTRVLVLVLVS